jgi:tetratricopeptide (TPR) repeat protein
LHIVTTNLVSLGKHLLHDFTVIGCVFGIVGVWALIRKEKNFLVFSGLVLAVLFYIGLNSAFISAYFIPAMALMGAWIGVGLGCSMDRLARVSEHIRPLPAARAVQAVGCGVLAASFCLLLAVHFRDMDRSDARYALQYGEEALESFPQGSVFFADDDHQIFILWYLIFCEHRRSDVIVVTPSWLVHGGTELLSSIVQQYPNLVLPAEETVSEYVSRVEEYADPWEKTYMGIQAFMDANHAKRPIYWGMIRLKLTFFQHLIPDGLTYRYSAQPISLDDSVLQQNRNFWHSITESAKKDPAIRRDAITLRVYPLLLNNQGLMFRHLGRDDEARWAIELALEFNPEFAPARHNLGNLEARARRYESAIRAYKQTIQSDPYFALAYNELGNVYKSLGRFDEADEAYEMALKIDPAFHQAITALGQLRLLLGRKEDAVREFRQALEIEPNDAVALRGLASLYLEMGNLPESKTLLDKALRVEPKSAAALLMLAKYHSMIGDEEGSAEALSRAIEAGGRLYLHMALNEPSLNRIARRLIQSGAQQ